MVYEAGVWFFTKTFSPEYHVMHLYPILGAFFVGYTFALFLVYSATGDLKEGPLKLMTIRRYNDILKLDVGHEMAVRGTSMSMGLPEERVREWVAKQKGKMKIR